MRTLLCLVLVAIVLEPRPAAACVRPEDGLVPHVLEAAYANDTVPPPAPTVTYSVSRTEVGGDGCSTTDCDGKYGRIYIDVVARDDAAPAERLGYLVRVVGGGDVPRELITPWFDDDARQQPQGSFAYGFDYGDDAFDFELEVRLVDLNGNISEPAIVRIADEQSDGGGCSIGASPLFGWALVLGAIAMSLRRRRSPRMSPRS